MEPSPKPIRGTWLSPFLALVVFAGIGSGSHAFPPAPHHVIYGLVRDELGNPLQLANAEILFEVSSGTKLSAQIGFGSEPGQNYQISIPMDSGITSDLYMPTAMRPTMPFKIRVRIGNTIYLPIEMSGDYQFLGQPGKRTRLNLTLGEDADHDGLPDAWERALIAANRKNQSLADINPGDDSDGDGLTNLGEYVAGTYAFDKMDGYDLKIIGTQGKTVHLEFMAIRGRAYAIQSSADLVHWSPIPFRISEPGNTSSGPLLENYSADKVRVVRIEVEPKPGQEGTGFFKLFIQ